jgi:hypothetical protein
VEEMDALAREKLAVVGSGKPCDVVRRRLFPAGDALKVLQ